MAPKGRKAASNPVTNPQSDRTLERLLELHPKLVDLSLGRIERLLAALDHPERKLPPVVHVTGTNGKGSTLAFLRAMLEAAGYRVHVYTSPHLVRFHERIRLASGIISEPHLNAVLERCETANAGEAITFFEITTAAAFVAFAEEPADIVLLENGLGGRLDATNVIEKPLLTGITTVSMDHQQFLGDTLSLIAAEKAGIIKPGVPCVLGPQADEALTVLRKKAEEVGAPLLIYGADWQIETLDLPVPSLPGGHQRINAVMAAVMAQNLQGFEISDDARRAGVRCAEWPGRLQQLKYGPAVDALPPEWEIWLDGGHNPDAGLAMAAHAADAWSDRPLYLVAGMIDSKDRSGFFRPLAAQAASTLTVSIPNEKAAVSATDLAAQAAAAGHQAAVAGSVLDAVRMHAARPGPARILICGSLYLAGKVLSQNG